MELNFVHSELTLAHNYVRFEVKDILNAYTLYCFKINLHIAIFVHHNSTAIRPCNFHTAIGTLLDFVAVEFYFIHAVHSLVDRHITTDYHAILLNNAALRSISSRSAMCNFIARRLSKPRLEKLRKIAEPSESRKST